MRMLDEMLDVIGAGLKKAGWEDQKAKGLTPTGLFPPDGPQWTTTETDPTRVKTAGDWLYQNKPLLFGYNSTDQATSIVIGSSIVNQAWSGDMMYAIRPDQPSGARPTADYLIPTQGSTWWVDCAAIHSRSRNLWLAHEFLNFIHDPAQNKTLTVWNLYSTPNRGTYETLLTEPFPSGWIMSEDPRLYPNIYDPDKFRVCDPSRDIGLDTMRRLYNPLWFDLVTG
jgi:spermidine/putrescine-binding protein